MNHKLTIWIIEEDDEGHGLFRAECPDLPVAVYGYGLDEALAALGHQIARALQSPRFRGSSPSFVVPMDRDHLARLSKEMS